MKKPHPVIDSLRSIRQAKGLSQLDVSSTMNSHPGAVCRYEGGRVVPLLDALCSWADALDCDVVIKPRG